MRIRPLSADAPVSPTVSTDSSKKFDAVKWGLVALAVVGAYFVVFHEPKNTNYRPTHL